MVVKLVVFDVDGTLTLHTSIWWRLHEHFKTEKEGKLFYDQYFSGQISYNKWADLDAGLWKGQSLEEVMKLVEATELVPGAAETVASLKERGIYVAILSGGLDILAENIARRLGIEYVLSNRLIHRNGVLTGEVEVCVGWGEKVQELKHISNHFKVPLSETAYVGDGRNDISVFGVVGLSIAFKPEDKEVAKSAMLTIKENDLRSILPHVI
ncbi:MAG: HAD family hydrolase [Promethearchaeota archaeon]